jgi:hypothetical protein
LGIG